jgi:protein transport protein DSL1/ZW10
LDELLSALERLDSVEGALRSISKLYQRRICQPVLSPSCGICSASIDQDSHSLTLGTGGSKKDVMNVLDCISTVFEFLHRHFPQQLSTFIGRTIVEDSIGALIDEWLTPSIPLDLSDMQAFGDIQSKTNELASLIASFQWPGHQLLTKWVVRASQSWLEKRRTSSLDAVRRALKAQRGPNREVERIEREKVSGDDNTFAQNGADDWHANWDDNEEEPKETTAVTTNRDEEDVSGWDFDEEDNNNGSAVNSPTKTSRDAEDAVDAWGWDEDNVDETKSNSHPSQKAATKSTGTNGITEHREVTLTETYTITDIPDDLLDILSREIQDAEQLKGPTYSNFHGENASAGLLALPTLILAMFRAIAPTYYSSTLSNGNMHLYNDCVYMNEKLRNLAKSISSRELLQDCNVLEKFARSAYSREMEVQRTVIGDLLDGAQGFVNCTRFPYSAECENAVTSVIDRLRAVYREWRSILSRSALLQSIGSLLSTVIEKIVKDVEDMEDISEAESQRLAAFCGQFSALEDLFMAERTPAGEKPEGEAMPLTVVYVPNWLRFQYLANILESSLVDIKYLWTEGELSLEFTADEVIDLIEALFAESGHRRSAIAEIRRSRP